MQAGSNVSFADYVLGVEDVIVNLLSRKGLDRFLLRVRCDNVPDKQMADVLAAGWRLDQGQYNQEQGGMPSTLSVAEIEAVQELVGQVDLAGVRPAYIETLGRLRSAGIPVSDRRAVKLQKLVAASAVLCGRRQADTTDLWVLRYIWDTEDQREVIAAIVNQAVEASSAQALETSHPRARKLEGPDPEALARDLTRIGERLADPRLAEGERTLLRDQLSLLAGRAQWIISRQAREHLDSQVAALWKQLGA